LEKKFRKDIRGDLIMLKYAVIIFFGIFAIGLPGCNIKTPEIRGIVLDAETKQPVEGVWITATLGIKTKTVAGNVHRYLSVENPHTRTDKSGGFFIPSKSFKKPPFPFGFETDVETFGVGASTVDDRGGSLSLMEFLRKTKAEITLYIKPEYTADTEKEYFTYLQGLYNYCLTGRFYVEVPAVKGGCDGWELDYAITKHGRYLERYKKYAEEGKAKGYFVALEQQTYLYEKKGNFKKAIETLKESMALMQRRGLLKFEAWQKDKAEIERRIENLQRKLQEMQK
jgi:hypothetical protein